MFAALTLAAVLAASPAPTAEQVQAVQDQVQAFSDKDKAEALAAAKVIIEKFGQPAAPAAETKPAQPQGKTMADVADKALDISTKYIGQVAAVLEKAAPHVYKIMVRQQYAKAMGEIIGPLLWLLIPLIIASIIRHYWRIQRENVYDDKHNRTIEASSDDERAAHVGVTLVVPGILTLIAAGFFIYNLSQSIMYLVNPEYYAIKDLVQILLHPGSL